MKTYPQRLKAALLFAGISQSELARRASVLLGARITPQSVQHLCNEEKNATGSKYTNVFASVLNVSAPWLEREEGGMLNINIDTPDRRVSRENVSPGPDLQRQVPLISWVQAGEWHSIVDTFEVGQAEDYFYTPKKCGPNSFMLRVRGPSMEPKYQDGDLIYVDPSAQYQHNSNVIVKLTDDQEATFKRLVIVGEKRWLEPLNPDWPEKIIPMGNDARIVGVVFGKYVPD